MSAGKGDTPRPVNGDAFRDNYEAAFRKKETTEPEEWHPKGIEWKPEYGRMLRSGERLQDGDEVYVGNDKWETIYLANFQEQYVRNGLYRRKSKWPHDDNPFMSADHDNDSTTYNQIFGPELPSRRYTCEGCGEKWRRNNTVEGRTAPPICPSCHNDLMNFKRIEKMIPKIIHLKAKYPEL
jgi:rubrerythrin